MTHGEILLLMTALFLIFGYMGVPVVFALMAGVLTACLLTPISMQSMIGQMFHGIDSEILLAVPFFLLVGELMTSANVTNRMIALAQTMVGHMRGGLASHLPPQHNQLISERGVLCLKTALGLQRRSEQR